MICIHTYTDTDTFQHHIRTMARGSFRMSLASMFTAAMSFTTTPTRSPVP